MIRILRAPLEAAMIFKAKADVRFYLEGILFKADGRVAATDGHKLFISEHDDSECKLSEDVIIKISRTPTKTYHHAEICTLTNTARFVTSNHECIDISMIEVVEGRYPNVDRLINLEPTPTDVIGLNAEYLMQIIKATKKFNTGFDVIKMTMQGADKSAHIDIPNNLGVTAKCTLMPCRI